MQINARYVPPAMDGFIFYSNFPRADYDSTPHREHTVEEVGYIAASRFDIPIEDVLVVEFNPDGNPSTVYHTAFAAYVRDKHRPLLDSFQSDLAEKMALLRFLHDF